MAQAVLRVEALPHAPLDAAEAFYEAWMPQARAACRVNDAVAVVFPAAAYDHRGWRLAAVQDLAREAAPRRINGIAGDDDRAIAETLHWLASAEGVTGQLLAVDGKFTENG
jgi:hypothetical protein